MLAPVIVGASIYIYNWRAAFMFTGALGLIWVLLWLRFYDSPAHHAKLSAEEREYIASGQEQHLQGDGRRPSMLAIIKQRNFWGIALPRFLADPTWGTLSFWLPVYLTEVRHFELKQIAMFAWLPFLAADAGCLVGGTINQTLQKYGKLSLLNARRAAFTRTCLMMGVGLVKWSRVLTLLLSFAWAALLIGLSVTVITMSSDLFKKNSNNSSRHGRYLRNAGLLLFNLMIGALVLKIGYTPFFVCLGVLDLVGAVVLWTVVRERAVVREEWRFE
jgi:ACS family hexuronate transporter-like MFS transporter